MEAGNLGRIYDIVKRAALDNEHPFIAALIEDGWSDQKYAQFLKIEDPVLKGYGLNGPNRSALYEQIRIARGNN